MTKSPSVEWAKKVEALDASAFSKRVWNAMLRIPKGKVATYAAVARAIGSPHAARAVGNACNANPLAPNVPCHRIVASDGKIGGYALGLPKKIALLKSEGVHVSKGRVHDFERVAHVFKSKK